MRQISIKNLYKNLSKEFENLPFEVTKQGKIIAKVAQSIDIVKEGLDKKASKCVHKTVGVSFSISRDDPAITKIKEAKADPFFKPYPKDKQTGKGKGV